MWDYTINDKHELLTVQHRGVCSTCGDEFGKMRKCIKCGKTSVTPIIQEKPRTIKKGFYEVPVCARRHLSKPLKRMNQETQSVITLFNENEYILG